jgi:hypothetical protein
LLLGKRFLSKLNAESLAFDSHFGLAIAWLLEKASKVYKDRERIQYHEKGIRVWLEHTLQNMNQVHDSNPMTL